MFRDHAHTVGMGMQTGRLVLDGLLGSGSFGQVFRARITTSSGVQRLVAVKVLRSRFTGDREAETRMRDEARILGAIHHRAVLEVLDYVRVDGRSAIVTEYIDGADLKAVLQHTGPLAPAVALRVVREVAAALHAAWSTVPTGQEEPLRVIHRDIKPSNVQVARDGRIKLIDFGIARTEHAPREACTEVGIVVGSHGCLAPERLLAESEGPPSDIYALGCVLFECLHGRRLFRRDAMSRFLRLALDAQEHDAHIASHVAAPTPCGDPIDPSVRSLLTRMLARRPAERPAASEVARACDDLAARLWGPSLQQWTRYLSWSPEPPALHPDRSIPTEPCIERAAVPLQPVACARSTPVDPVHDAPTLPFRVVQPILKRVWSSDRRPPTPAAGLEPEGTTRMFELPEEPSLGARLRDGFVAAATVSL